MVSPLGSVHVDGSSSEHLGTSAGVPESPLWAAWLSVTGRGQRGSTASTCHLEEMGPPCYLIWRTRFGHLFNRRKDDGPGGRGMAFKKVSRDLHRKVRTAFLKVWRGPLCPFQGLCEALFSSDTSVRCYVFFIDLNQNNPAQETQHSSGSGARISCLLFASHTRKRFTKLWNNATLLTNFFFIWKIQLLS